MDNRKMLMSYAVYYMEDKGVNEKEREIISDICDEFTKEELKEVIKRMEIRIEEHKKVGNKVRMIREELYKECMGGKDNRIRFNSELFGIITGDYSIKEVKHTEENSNLNNIIYNLAYMTPSKGKYENCINSIGYLTKVLMRKD